MQTLAAILAGKIIAFISRTLKIGGGAAAPGLYALKIQPNLVEGLVKKIPKNIIITGTNGKTTTARMLAHFAQSQGLKVIRNHTGSNLERGIASALINSYSHLTSGKVDLGIWELDEAAFQTVAPKIKPDLMVFLNVFRDQLDRYGEVDSVIKGWSNTLAKLDPKAIAVINGDDHNLLKLAESFKGKIYSFGVENYKIAGEGLNHQKENRKLDLEAKNVKLNGLSGSFFRLPITNYQLTINLPLPGIYNIYNALAAISTASFLNIPINQLTNQLSNFKSAFGRVEKFSLQPGRLHRKQEGFIFLIKNPTGATQVFQTLSSEFKKGDGLLLALNDNLADGTDVSWIWDSNFELLCHPERLAKDLKIYVSGTRAFDLAVRLKYAGFKITTSNVEPNIEKAFKKVQNSLKGRLFILPTYTAMLELQKILTKQGVKKHYWEEN